MYLTTKPRTFNIDLCQQYVKLCAVPVNKLQFQVQKSKFVFVVMFTCNLYYAYYAQYMKQLHFTVHMHLLLFGIDACMSMCM
jgi:hypothetical protein